MSKTVQIDDLVSISEIAVTAEVSKQAVCNWIGRYIDGSEFPFPTPVVELGCGKIYRWTEVEDWLVATGRFE